MLRSGRVMRSILFTVVTTVLAFVIFSCIPVTPGTNPKEVTIQTSRHGHITNAYVVYAKDGLSGTWIKLTGTNGVYKFTVNDSNGLYSVAVGEPDTEYQSMLIFSMQSCLKQILFRLMLGIQRNRMSLQLLSQFQMLKLINIYLCSSIMNIDFHFHRSWIARPMLLIITKRKG